MWEAEAAESHDWYCVPIQRRMSRGKFWVNSEEEYNCDSWYDSDRMRERKELIKSLCMFTMFCLFLPSYKVRNNHPSVSCWRPVAITDIQAFFRLFSDKNSSWSAPKLYISTCLLKRIIIILKDKAGDSQNFMSNVNKHHEKTQTIKLS